MTTIQNPILRGFNPDPSICRAGDDYYIATSTFEWWPGVQLHHSKDLVHWNLVGHALTEPKHIDLIGNPCSGGVWAPCLTWHDDQFWLIYSNVRSWQPNYKVVYNYLTTAPSIHGPWSEPIFLNNSGFDPSLFHDTDGKKYLVNQKWDHRKGRNRFDGIVLQEYDHQSKQLVGPITNIFAGSDFGCTEGPHLYRKDGFYWLMTAEGGTGHHHTVSLARSQDLLGPYELHPDHPLVTSRFDPELPLQKAGHGSWVDTPDNEWYQVHLCSRPLENGRCTLGRETAIQKLVWSDDGWPRLATGGFIPQTEVPGPKLPAHPWPSLPLRDDFDATTLSPHYASLRDHVHASWASLTARPGFLRLIGREALTSRHHQSLVARRIQSFHAEVSTCLEFQPTDYQHLAGLVFFYDCENYYFLHLRGTDDGHVGLNLKMMVDHEEDEALPEDIVLGQPERVFLRGIMHNDRLTFAYALEEGNWIALEHVCDASTLSDDFGDFNRGGHFTGAFAGLSCQDLSMGQLHADFDWFSYEEHDSSTGSQ
jgi:xylan 1,4-beta-xylosidase